MTNRSNPSGPYMGPEGPVSLSERQHICTQIVGAVAWGPEGSWGYCACPGADLHHNRTARRDCRVFAEETNRGGRTDPPGLHCLHTSCVGAVEEASRRLRSAIGKAKRAAGLASPSAPLGFPKSVRTVRQTARTGNFGLAEEKRGSSDTPKADLPTARTDGSRPLTRFAHVRTHPHVSDKVPLQASEPYVAPATKPQPEALPEATAATTRPTGHVPNAVEKPGLVTVWMNGEAPVRGEWQGADFVTHFQFNDKGKQP